MSIYEETAYRMSDEYIRRKLENKNMTRKVMREVDAREKKMRKVRGRMIALAIVFAMVGTGIGIKEAHDAREEDARLRACGAVVDRILVYDMAGNLIYD